MNQSPTIASRAFSAVVYLIVGVFCAYLTGMLDTSMFADEKKEHTPPASISLQGTWKFSLGDVAEWSDPKLDDSEWESIHVPGSWEEAGFHEYDGYAWYRKHLNKPDQNQQNVWILELGRIDDVDQVFLNGVEIGATGNFPPRYQTAYDQHRRYQISPSLWKESGNVLAIRVFDAEQEGGIMEGDIRMYPDPSLKVLPVDLAGRWKFTPGDSPQYREVEWDDSGWNDIQVPGIWEAQGFGGYDGIAWYRKAFPMPNVEQKEGWQLVLGKIDDLDEVYFNGQMIGTSGGWESLTEIDPGKWQEIRSYPIPAELIKEGENVVAVRVFDLSGEGGIFEGEVGLIQGNRSHIQTSNW
ncbi:hypothetical protein [Pontibacter sp. G13]|uniref:hypothetical protein n=1 Tax=Pontibacter sp. G13 TaxID=3074898 RepID=UPI00288B5FAD|nr:hypothetical protein [Pontibacter sp. G13]WNJ20182.1 hypothetical protein RJD25_06855 [Pontibacter sp. G13]